jgi:hypothetical protein
MDDSGPYDSEGKMQSDLSTIQRDPMCIFENVGGQLVAVWFVQKH